MSESSETAEANHRRVITGQALRFLVVGVASYAVDLAVLASLAHVNVSLPVAASAGWLTSFVLNFSLNKVWSFESDAPLRGAGIRYALLAAANYLVTVVAVPALAWSGMGLGLAKTIVVIVLAACNFVLYRLWVFPRSQAVS